MIWVLYIIEIDRKLFIFKWSSCNLLNKLQIPIYIDHVIFIKISINRMNLNNKHKSPKIFKNLLFRIQCPLFRTRCLL